MADVGGTFPETLPLLKIAQNTASGNQPILIWQETLSSIKIALRK